MDERGRWVNEVCVFGEMALSLEEGEVGFVFVRLAGTLQRDSDDDSAVTGK